MCEGGIDRNMDNITLKTLAKELNVSTSTISRALRGSHEISQKTQERVKALAEQLGFVPNAYASSLRQSKSKTIAVIIPEIENHFFSLAMKGVEEIAQKKKYHVLIYITNEDINREKEILKVLRNGRVDGVMISVSNSTEDFTHLKELSNTGLPLVCFDRVADDIDVPKITTDDQEAAEMATTHLLERGCKRIAFLSMSGKLSISNQRKNGYMKALQKRGLAKEALVLECGTDDAVNRQKIKQLLKGKNMPDAIFAAVEKLAINTYEVCREQSINIPDQLKVIGFSNLSAAALFAPSLSTIVQPARLIGKEAAAVLFKLIEQKPLLKLEKNQRLPSTIVSRRSTETS